MDGKALNIAFNVPIFHKGEAAHACQQFAALTAGGCTAGCQAPGKFAPNPAPFLNLMHAQIPRALASGSARKMQWAQDSEREMAAQTMCVQAQCDPRQLLSDPPATAPQLEACPPLKRPLPFSDGFMWGQLAPGYEKVSTFPICSLLSSLSRCMQVPKPRAEGIYMHKFGDAPPPTQPSKYLAHPREGGFWVKRLVDKKQGAFGQTLYAVEWTDGQDESGGLDW